MILRYENVVGLTEVKAAQARVVECERKFIETQEMQDFFHQDSGRTMYDILQPNILSRIVPLLSDTLAKKKKSLYHLFIDGRKTMHATWGKEETTQIKKETMH